MYVPYKIQMMARPFSAALRRLIGTVTHVRTQHPLAALTFDDGPYTECTPRLLDILERYQARATFFMVGEAAQRQPALVRRVAEGGHAIGNHSWDHPSFPLITGRERRKQLRACQQCLAPYGARVFRPPYGHQSVASHLDAVRLGLGVVTWSVVAKDWMDRDAQWMAEQVLSQAQRGSIILFHDALYTTEAERYRDREPTLKAVEMVLEHLRGRLQFVTVPELLRHGKPQREHWYMPAPIDYLNKLLGPDGGPARQYGPAGGRKQYAPVTR